MALTKAVILKVDSPGVPPIPVMFNPPQYELAKTNQFAEIKIPGLRTSVLQFVNGNAKTLTLELFFDTTDTGVDVRLRTSAIASLTEPESVTRAPPRLLLLWGSLAFPCFLVSVRQRFDYFNSAGMPLRATLNVEFKGHDNVESSLAMSPIAQAEQAARYVVAVGDTLQSIATKVYGNPRQWREIAAANNLADPRTLASGLGLTIPKLP